jgi:hypothetical protein
MLNETAAGGETVTEGQAYEVGQSVEVFSFGRWYGGAVRKVGRSRIHVHYVTGTGAERVKAFGPRKVRARATVAA